MTALEIAKKIYEARLSNRADDVLPFFHDDAAFCISGDAGCCGVACDMCGDGAFRAVMPDLARDWLWRSTTLLDEVDGGDRAAIRYRLEIEHGPSGRTLTTIVFDLVELEDGKVRRMVQHVDTAAINALLAEAA